MYWVNTFVRKLSIEPTPKVRAMFQHIFHCIIVVHVVKHQSVIIIININKYMLLKLCISYVANYSAYVYGECLYLYNYN